MPKSTREKLAVIGPEYVRELGFKSIRDLVEDEKSSRRNIRIRTLLELRTDGKAVLREILFDMLDQVRTMTGVKHFIDIDGLKYFVDYVIEDHSRLTVGDLQVYCRNIITGKYGNSYENISVQKLIMWLQEYESSRAEKVYMIKRSMEREKEKHDGEIDREGLLRMAQVFERVNKKRLQKVAEREVKRNQEKYKNIWDYIERNDLEEDEFLETFISRHVRIMKAKGINPEKFESVLFEKIIMNEMRLFVEDQNQNLTPSRVSA